MIFRKPIKAESVAAVGLLLYYSWWLYVLFGFGAKEYDNSFAGAAASMFIAGVTTLVVFLFLTWFIWAAFVTGRRKRYAIYMALIIAPLVLIALYLARNIDQYKPAVISMNFNYLWGNSC